LNEDFYGARYYCSLAFGVVVPLSQNYSVLLHTEEQ
jgi:hypothetical protein